MKLGAIALDYDGTIATDGVFEPSVRDAIAELRLEGLSIILVTGRRLDELQSVAGSLGCFNAVVAENGAVLYFPESGRQALIGHRPPVVFIDALRAEGVAFKAGQSVVETDASEAPAVLKLVRRLEQPLILAFNRSRLMVLPQAIAKSIGLRRVLATLRISIHNTIGIGDAENDHDLLDACEVGVAVAWGSLALRTVADQVIAGDGPPAVAAYLRDLLGHVRLSTAQMGRRRLLLGTRHDGEPVYLAIRGRTVLVAGEPGSGKSSLAGLLCEQLILQNYCLCVIDPEGDYRSLEALPSVIVLGGDNPPPSPRELIQALRYPDVSIVIDLSKIGHPEKRAYLHELLPLLASLRRRTGLPHKIVLDEAHYYLAEPEGWALIDTELAGYILVTYRVSGLDPAIRAVGDIVVIVTRETDQQEREALCAISPAEGVGMPQTLFENLKFGEAVILPGVEESQGGPQRFTLAPRLTSHVRHRTKYLDMPVADSLAFTFTSDGQPGVRARSLKDLVVFLSTLSDDHIAGHVERHDFSQWLEHVFRDRPLATHIRGIENRIATEPTREIALDIAQAIRARYEMSSITH